MNANAIALATTAITVRLSPNSAKELEQLCHQEAKEISELVGLGLAFTRLYFEEKKRGNAVVIITPGGVALKSVHI